MTDESSIMLEDAAASLRGTAPRMQLTAAARENGELRAPRQAVAEACAAGLASGPPSRGDAAPESAARDARAARLLDVHLPQPAAKRPHAGDDAAEPVVPRDEPQQARNGATAATMDQGSAHLNAAGHRTVQLDEPPPRRPAMPQPGIDLDPDDPTWVRSPISPGRAPPDERSSEPPDPDARWPEPAVATPSAQPIVARQGPRGRRRAPAAAHSGAEAGDRGTHSAIVGCDEQPRMKAGPLWILPAWNARPTRPRAGHAGAPAFVSSARGMGALSPVARRAGRMSRLWRIGDVRCVSRTGYLAYADDGGWPQCGAE
jgi:hypothetical protein